MSKSIAIVGGGPAGLMAAEVAAGAGAAVAVYDAMASVGRKFLLAGKGGLNLTHSETPAAFLSRYGARADRLAPLLEAFGARQLRDWAQGLGIGTVEGSSGRVFPADMKAAPLLRAWLNRLRSAGVKFHVRHRWTGWQDDGALVFDTPRGARSARAEAVVLALGGASWPQLGSDGAWVPLLEARGVAIAPLAPANCGFDVGWTPHFRGRFAGEPVKSVIVSYADGEGRERRQPGEFVVTENGVEGGLIYTISPILRDRIAAAGHATIVLDLAPDRSRERLERELAHARGRRSVSGHLQSRTGMKGVKVGLLREFVPAQDFGEPARLAAHIKSLPLRLVAPRPVAEAISTAGGVSFDALDENLMLTALSGVFCAGEMLDWEAPTGGYLLTACFASGRAAGAGAVEWLKISR